MRFYAIRDTARLLDSPSLSLSLETPTENPPSSDGPGIANHDLLRATRRYSVRTNSAQLGAPLAAPLTSGTALGKALWHVGSITAT